MRNQNNRKIYQKKRPKTKSTLQYNLPLHVYTNCKREITRRDQITGLTFFHLTSRERTDAMPKVHRILCILMVLIIGVTLTACENMLYSKTETVTTTDLPWEETPPPLRYPDDETSPPETEAETVNTAQTTEQKPMNVTLEWEPIERRLKNNKISGEIISFDTQGFAMFIPDEFSETQTDDAKSTSANRRLATFENKDKTYSFTITRGRLPYKIDSLDELPTLFDDNDGVTVYNATINGMPFVDIESYEDDILTFITRATNYIEMEPDEDSYFTFTFAPMSNRAYSDLTISILSSIKKIEPKTIPHPTETEPPETSPPVTEAPETEKPETTAPETTPVETNPPAPAKPEPVAMPPVETQKPQETVAPAPPVPTHQHTWVNITQTINHPAEYKTVHHDAEYQTIQHDAEYYLKHHDDIYEPVWIVDVPGWDEWIMTQEGYYDTIIETHYVCNICGTDFGITPPSDDMHFLVELLDGWPSEIIGYHLENVEVPYNYHQPVYTLVQHPEEGHFELVLKEAAWDEWILEKDPWTEQVLVKEAWDEQVLVKEAWTETIITGQRCSGCGATK